jgi:hypothetical protein
MHLIPVYDLQVMYHFMVTARVRNSHTFVWWAIVQAGVSYGSSDKLLSQRNAVFFGHSSTQGTLLGNLGKYWQTIENCPQFDGQYRFSLSVFDNEQQGHCLHYQWVPFQISLWNLLRRCSWSYGCHLLAVSTTLNHSMRR